MTPIIGTTRRLARALVPTLLSTVLACHHDVRVRTAESGSDVRVAFAAPRTLTLAGPRGDTAVAAGIVQAKGRVLASDSGRIQLRIASLIDSSGRRVATPSGTRASIPLDGSSRIERSETSIWRTALAAFGICIGVFALGIALGGGGP